MLSFHAGWVRVQSLVVRAPVRSTSTPSLTNVTDGRMDDDYNRRQHLECCSGIIHVSRHEKQLGEAALMSDGLYAYEVCVRAVLKTWALVYTATFFTSIGWYGHAYRHATHHVRRTGHVRRTVGKLSLRGFKEYQQACSYALDMPSSMMTRVYIGCAESRQLVLLLAPEPDCELGGHQGVSPPQQGRLTGTRC